MKKLLVSVVICFFIVSQIHGALACIKMMRGSGLQGNRTLFVEDYKNTSLFRMLEQERVKQQREKAHKESQEWYKKTSAYWLKNLIDWYLSFCCHPFPKERTALFCQMLIGLCTKGVVCDVLFDDSWTPLMYLVPFADHVGEIESVRCMLECGADPNFSSYRPGMSILKSAFGKAMRDLLISYGAKE